MNRRTLERRLSSLAGFSDPDPELEQYPTPADLAAHLLHLADLQGDLRRPVLDLGAGTGILAIGAALKGARAVGIERDPGALAVARENAAAAGVDPSWIRGDATRPPIPDRDPDPDAVESDAGGITVVANPPFGAQDASRGDRPFLATAAGIATVSYTVHNAGSQAFVEAFAGDNGGSVTHAFRADLDLDRQFPFHEDDRRTIESEVFRIEWG